MQRSGSCPMPAVNPHHKLCVAILVMVSAAATAAGSETAHAIDISPFALPNSPRNELWFEEPRDVVLLVVELTGAAGEQFGVSYRRHYWPKTKVEERAKEDPMGFGWIPQDDLFNGSWQQAALIVERQRRNRLWITFCPLAEEFADQAGYSVSFRRSVAFRIDGVLPERIQRIQAYTTSPLAHTRFRVQLNAGGKSETHSVSVSSYNATIEGIDPLAGVHCSGSTVTLEAGAQHIFQVDVAHMSPAHTYCGDDGLVSFKFDQDVFTISLASLEREGPIWSPDFGVFIAKAEDPTTFADYQARNAGSKTLNQRVLEHAEQTFKDAYRGQPRPHAVPYFVGCALARQRFRVEPNGEVWIYPRNVQWVPGRDTDRCRMTGITHFRFDLESWRLLARNTDPEPANVYNLSVAREDVVLDEKVFAVPLLTPLSSGTWASDDPMVALVRLRFHNEGASVVPVELPLCIDQRNDEHAPPGDDPLSVEHTAGKESLVYGPGIDAGERVLRCAIETAMAVESGPRGILLRAELAPGKTCEAVVKIPHIVLETREELAALAQLNFLDAHADNTNYWRKIAEPATRVQTPEPRLNALYASHLSHVQVTDIEMPDGSCLINTSVGTSVYGNFSNESCMIVHELDERGLHDQARRRLELWIKYQSSVPQPGNFTDYDGMYFGAGGFEHGSYNQHHGWVLWALCEHFFLTGDEAWFRGVADSVIQGADWVFRQRKNTLEAIPHSRGWEKGFLPAGSLEDVVDFHYWLSTNALTWRAVNRVAQALEAIGHPDAARVRAEADAYRADLIQGFETARQHAPLVRLRDGRWVPNYPSRLYHRGRELGWIRETLEGSVYLLISGLYDANSREAQWILDDYQDNRYPSPPYGYFIPDFENNWFNRAGISMQPNLLAGLLPHLDRDEPEIFLWMFYNAWCACYREEVNAMVEHPSPWLGYSNRVVFKTSDEANAASWLRYMFVFTKEDLLHFGRALPRAWFAQSVPFETQNAATPFGTAGVRYESNLDHRKIYATVSLDLRRDPGKILVRFRHPAAALLQSVTVNGQPHASFDAAKGDVDITGLRGSVTIEASY